VSPFSSHRVRGTPQVPLPLLPLLDMFAATPHLLVRNFALVYLELAFDRAPEKVRKNKGNGGGSILALYTYRSVVSPFLP
jgi:hypothetical protein